MDNNDCEYLTDIGNLQNWEINDIYMEYAFSNCKRLKNLGNFEQWCQKESNYVVFNNSSILYNLIATHLS